MSAKNSQEELKVKKDRHFCLSGERKQRRKEQIITF